MASGFVEVARPWWYTGDIPHGWAAAEFMLLTRDMMFFEADENRDPHIYIAPGVAEPGGAGVSNAPTVFGAPFGYRIRHDSAARTLTIDLEPLPPPVRYIYRCPHGRLIHADVDGRTIPLSGRDVQVPPGTRRVTLKYGAS